MCSCGIQFEGRTHLVHFPRITVQTVPHISNVGNDSFATITTSFLFTKDSGHFIAVFGIVDLLKNRLKGRHCGEHVRNNNIVNFAVASNEKNDLPAMIRRCSQFVLGDPSWMFWLKRYIQKINISVA